MKSRSRVLVAVAALLAAPLLAHVALGLACRIHPPEVSPQRSEPLRPKADLRTLDRSFVRERPGILEVHLEGTPERIGWAHARLLYPEMVENEGVLLANLQKAVPNAGLRTLLLDLAQLRYRDVDSAMSSERRAELAAAALAFTPDPYANVFPTYQRFVYLNALYDIALSFEHSPLIGCTTFTFSGAATTTGGAYLARNFDFEVDPIFDRKKAIFFVREQGKIPFASVAWPGLVGVVSGLNDAGVAIVVHGARAGKARTEGAPVVQALRAVLTDARTSDEAAAVLARRPPLVSHIVIVTDASGKSLQIERVPGLADHVVKLPERAAVANHFQGPSSSDPKDVTVRATTSTLARKARADELVEQMSAPVTAETLVGLLRDRHAKGGARLADGDRNAIDAQIATHGVVMNTAERVLWVSTAPHLQGRFLAFELGRAFAATAADAEAFELKVIE